MLKNMKIRTSLLMGFGAAVLRRAGIEECHLVAAVTGDDNTNLMVAQIAREIFRVPKQPGAQHPVAFFQTIAPRRFVKEDGAVLPQDAHNAFVGA